MVDFDTKAPRHREGWRTVKLGEVAEVQTGPFGSQLHEQDYVLSNGTPIVTVEHLGHRRFTTQNLPLVNSDDKERLKKYTLKTGDIVFSRVGSVDRCSFVSEAENGWMFSGRCLRVRPDTGIDNGYLYYHFCLPNTKKFVRDIAVGSTMPSINTGLMGTIPISLPPLATQRKIAGVLGALDDKIELNRKMNANLEAQAQALFKSWFVDFDPWGGKRPSGWREGMLGEVAEVVGGGTPSKAKNEYYTDNGIAWLTPKDLSITHAKFTSRGAIDITDAGYRNSGAKLMPKGSVLFSSRAPIGYLTIAQNDICTNQGFKSLVPKRLGMAYLYYYLKEKTPTIELMSSGSTFKEASGSLMKSLEISVPDDKTASDFESLMRPLFSRQELLERESRKLAELRDALLPKLMSGELEVA